MAFGLDDAIAAGLKVLDKFIPDPEARAKAEADLRSSLQNWDKAQTDVNAVEAASNNVFVAGWRPFIGWVGGSALAWQYVLAPFISWVGFCIGHPLPKPPTFDGSIYELVFALLGIGGMRTFEKIKGVAK